MNRILLTMLTALLMLFFFEACESPANKDAGNAQIAGIQQGDTITVYKDIGIIDRQDAKVLIRKFQQTPTPNTTHAVWFDTSLIRLLYDSLCTRPGRFDGVRVYFGVYPPGFDNIKPEHFNKLTVFFVPTMPSMYNGHKNSLDTFIFRKTDIKNLNHGELCPNNCDSIGNLEHLP